MSSTGNKFANFGQQTWQILSSPPLGTKSKRELEIALIEAAIETGLIDNTTLDLAQKMGLTMRRAQAYFTEIALRKPLLTDTEAAAKLLAALQRLEIISESSHLSMPLNDASLQIWCERKMALIGLHPGEVLRNGIFKLTPHALGKLLDAMESVKQPTAAIKAFTKDDQQNSWIDQARKSWRNNTRWPEALQALGSLSSVLQAVVAVLKY